MFKNDLKQRFPNNHIIKDQTGKDSVMVYIEKFYLDEVMDSAPHISHPAFNVDGKEIDGIYISKFQNVLVDGLAYSLPDKDPATNIDFDSAIKACTEKGDGFHLMTAMEWGAVALWCQKNGWLPYGNNDMGKDVREDDVTAKIAYYNEEKAICRVATGTEPVEWSHNKQEDGIYDLNANVWEWIGGLRLVHGELQILPDNNAALGSYSQVESSSDWRAINGATSELIIPCRSGNTKNSIKLDFIDGNWTYISSEIQNSLDNFRFCNFTDVLVDSSICDSAKALLFSLGCIPPPTYKDTSVSFYANNGANERIPFRGGRWGQGLNTGIFKTCLDDPRTFSGDAVGFRSAYCKISGNNK